MDRYFAYELNTKTKKPFNDELCKVNNTTKKLDEERKSIFHTFVMKLILLCKRGRPDIEPGVSFLSTRTTKPDKSDEEIC